MMRRLPNPATKREDLKRYKWWFRWYAEYLLLR
jgi:hypothetical protein